MEFSICWLTSPPNIRKIYRYFLLSKNDFWLILRLFIFSPLKNQKYLEKFYNSAKGVVGEGGGGVIREKNKSVLNGLKWLFYILKVNKE